MASRKVNTREPFNFRGQSGLKLTKAMLAGLIISGASRMERKSTRRHRLWNRKEII